MLKVATDYLKSKLDHCSNQVCEYLSPEKRLSMASERVIHPPNYVSHHLPHVAESHPRKACSRENDDVYYHQNRAATHFAQVQRPNPFESQRRTKNPAVNR